MCITRVGKVLDKNGESASVKFLDDNMVRIVDVSMLEGVKRNSYVEVFADRALNTLKASEARWKKKIWVELRERSGEKSVEDKENQARP